MTEKLFTGALRINQPTNQPNCNNPSKFSDRQVYASSVDQDQIPVPSGFTMFAILSASFWAIMSKNDPDQE